MFIGRNILIRNKANSFAKEYKPTNSLKNFHKDI